MKQIIIIIFLFVSFGASAQLDIRPKLGNGTYPIDTILNPKRGRTTQHWKSIGPYPQLKNSSNSSNKKTRTTAPILNNSGLGFATSLFIPLDNNVAISNSNDIFWDRQVVALCNAKVEFFDENSNALSATGLNFWVNNSTLFPNSNGFFDPKIIYDPKNDHFIATLLYYDDAASKKGSKIVILVSHNGDPVNGWEVFSINAPTGYLFGHKQNSIAFKYIC